MFQNKDQSALKIQGSFFNHTHIYLNCKKIYFSNFAKTVGSKFHKKMIQYVPFLSNYL